MYMNIWECSDGKAFSLKSSDAEKTIYDIKKQHIRVMDHNSDMLLLTCLKKNEMSIIKTKQKQPERKKKQIKNNIKVQNIHVDLC